jgi:hypothetical protein
MQLAILIPLLVFLLFPGIFFRLGYLKRDGLQSVAGTKFYIEILFIISVALAFHFLAWIILEKYHYDFQAQLFFDIISGHEVQIGDHKDEILLFITYNFLCSLIIFLVGTILRFTFTLLRVKFSQNLQFLDYTGNWDRILSYKKPRSLKSRDILANVDVLTEIEQKGIIYSGILRRYYINSKGYIDKLILQDVSRMTMEEYNHEVLVNGDKKIAKISGVENNEDSNNQSESLDSPLKQELNEMIEFSSEQTEELVDKRVKIPNDHFVIYGSTILNVGIRYEGVVSKTKSEYLNKVRKMFENKSIEPPSCPSTDGRSE